jgi:hypothetical protein
MVRRIHKGNLPPNAATLHGVVFDIFVFGPQPMEQGTLKKPRNRTRPPRTG